MYINLKPYLTQPVSKIDINTLIKHDSDGWNCFTWNGSTYYPKFYPKTPNLNELIGEQLAKSINLRTVSFEIFEEINGETIIASKSFINPNSKYYTLFCDILNYKNLEDLRSKCIDDKNYQQLLNNIFKMFAIDIYMDQRDRGYQNFQFEEYDTGYFDLAPLYDYTESNWDENLYYDNPLYCLNDTDELDDYNQLFATYPLSLEMIKLIKETNLRKILERIEQTKRIKLPQNIIDIYLKREEISQKKLEKIINN